MTVVVCGLDRLPGRCLEMVASCLTRDRDRMDGLRVLGHARGGTAEPFDGVGEAVRVVSARCLRQVDEPLT